MMQSIKLCPKVKQNDFSGKQKRVGILGGSFNPPHVAHLIMAEQARVQLNLDKIFFMPSHIPPHVDEKKTIDANYRVEMTQLAIRDNYHFDLETIELERTEKSYSFDTIQLLKEKNPDVDYYFIIGGDMVDYFMKFNLWEFVVRDIQKKLHIQYYGLKRLKWKLVQHKFEKMCYGDKVFVTLFQKV